MVAKRRSSPVRLACALILAVLALTPAACGGDDDDEPAKRSSDQGRQIEKAFLTGMVHHHETAIEMAEIAQQRGQDPFIKTLATAIVGTQEREIAQMKSIYTRLFDAQLKPDPRAHDAMGMSAQEAGMTHDEHTNEKLQAADPFDRAFVDEMVPHHRGAIAMSNVLLDHTQDPALKTLANTIVRTQRREIEEMNEFRTKKFGGPGPASAGHGESTETSTSGEHESGH